MLTPVARLLLAVPLVLFGGCASSRTVNAPTPSAPAGKVPASPLSATFVALGDAFLGDAGACDVRFVGVAHGRATVGDAALGEGDVLIVHGPGDLAAHGDGLAVLATYHRDTCSAPPPALRRVVRATEAPELTWANGAMHAHLDVENEPGVYFGRLSGTAPIALHTHDASWEMLCAIDAAGIFTLDGVDTRIGARQVVLVPPGHKHAWTPDAGSALLAFQLYSPPGPEQRFQKLAGAAP